MGVAALRIYYVIRGTVFIIAETLRDAYRALVGR